MFNVKSIDNPSTVNNFFFLGHQKQVSRISTALKAIDDLEAGLNKQKGITGQQQIQLKGTVQS